MPGPGCGHTPGGVRLPCDHSQLGLSTPPGWMPGLLLPLRPHSPAPGPRPAPLHTLDCLSPPSTVGAPGPRPCHRILPSLLWSSARHTAGTAKARWRSGCGAKDGSSDLCSCPHALGEWRTGQAGSRAGAAPKRARMFAELSGRVKPELKDFSGIPGVRAPPPHAGAAGSTPDHGAKIPHSSKPRKPKPQKWKR